jgi:hypothetical protein
LGASDLGTFFVATDGLGTLAELRDAESAGRITGLMTKQLRDLLP